MVKFQSTSMFTNLAFLDRKHAVVCKSNEFGALSTDFHCENMDIFPWSMKRFANFSGILKNIEIEDDMSLW